MPTIQIFVNSENDSGLDKRIINYAKNILFAADPRKDAGLVKQKQSGKRSRFVYKLDVDGVGYYFKLYSNHHRLKGFQDLFRGQRARRALDISVALRDIGIDVARPVAAFEISGANCQKRSVFVTEEISGVPFKHLFTQEKDEVQQQTAFQLLSQVYQDLVDNRIYHYDLNLANCWLDGDQVILLDVDDIRQLRRLGLFRLYLNIEKHNRILLRHTKRFPDSWLKNHHRLSVIKELSSKYVKPAILKAFVSYVERVSMRHVLKSSAFK